MTVQEYLIKHEGLSLNIYHDQYSNQTIGVGRNLDSKGISKEEALMMLDNDIRDSLYDLKAIFPNWDSISPNRQMVLIDMDFQLGTSGFKYFKKFIQAVLRQDWEEAVKEIVDSMYYKQVSTRAKDNIALLQEG
jgi:lysozyme